MRTVTGTAMSDDEWWEMLRRDVDAEAEHRGAKRQGEVTEEEVQYAAKMALRKRGVDI